MKRRVLAIDDDAGVRLTIRHILSTNGYEVILCSDGKDIEHLLDQYKPEVVITDLVMPDIEGPEVIMRAKSHWPDVKIIAISGGARIGRADILETARSAGADRLMSKPFSFGELLTAVEEVISANSSN